MDLYIRFSRMARAIYHDYSDQVESFGLDECWLDVTKTCHLFIGIRTIGDLAAADSQILKEWFGKVGLMLSVFARGEDQTPVSEVGLKHPSRASATVRLHQGIW
ncbi:ImpB/MucB/SamB domain protein [Shuttleworthella sp. MSX8B]|nr:ImpB/MucB/SamB domain protein [Shuttleworthia sp. MSX8B]